MRQCTATLYNHTSISPLPRLIEIKVKTSGEKQCFTLELWHERNDFIVGRWVATEKDNFSLPVGSYSWGVWPLHKPHWGAYRIHLPCDKLLKYRFDALHGTKCVEKEGIKYLIFNDAVLDATVDYSSRDSSPQVEFLDEDEVKMMQLSGTLDLQCENAISNFRTSMSFPCIRETLSYVDHAISVALDHQNLK